MLSDILCSFIKIRLKQQQQQQRNLTNTHTHTNKKWTNRTHLTNQKKKSTTHNYKNSVVKKMNAKEKNYNITILGN